MLVKDVMTTQVITVAPQTEVGDVTRTLLSFRIGAVPVVANGEVLGLLGETELMAGALRSVEAPTRIAEEVMSRSYVTIAPDAPLSELVAALADSGTHCLLVTRSERLVGIVTRADVLRALSTLPPLACASPSEDDRNIRTALVHRIGSPTGDSRRVSPLVCNGVVHLWGLVVSDEDRREVCSIAAKTPGVCALEDHLVVATMQGWPDGLDTPTHVANRLVPP